MSYIPPTHSVVAFQSDPTKLVGTVSVAGNVGVSVVGLTPVGLNVGGNPVSATNPVAVQPPASGFLNVSTSNGSVISVVKDSVATVIIGGSIAASFTPPANQSVSGTVGASVVGHAPVVIVGGSILTSSTPNQSVSGTVQTDVRGSVATVIIGGSIATTTGNSSVQVLNFPTNQNVDGSVIAFQGGTWRTSLVSTVPSSVIVGASIFGLAPVNVTNTNLNVGGSVVAFQGGTQITSLVSTVPSSVIVGASIFGLAPVNVTNTNLNVSGSVVAFQGAGWSGSVASHIRSGSVIAVLGGNTSIAGTFTEDTAHTSGAQGVFMLGVRNDTLASVTSADLDYSPMTVGPAGENIVANAPLTRWVQGRASLLNGASWGVLQPVIAAQGSSVFTYVTGVQVANFSGSSVLVSFTGGQDSVIGYTIAPAGGGSNIIYPNALKTNANAAFGASVSGTSSVFVSAQGFISRI